MERWGLLQAPSHKHILGVVNFLQMEPERRSCSIPVPSKSEHWIGALLISNSKLRLRYVLVLLVY